MSSPKPIQIPPPDHVKFTKAGRAYADMDKLIDHELARVGGQPLGQNEAQPPQPNEAANNQPNQNPQNGNQAR
jgi:hypothetical protein